MVIFGCRIVTHVPPVPRFAAHGQQHRGKGCLGYDSHISFKVTKKGPQPSKVFSHLGRVPFFNLHRIWNTRFDATFHGTHLSAHVHPGFVLQRADERRNHGGGAVKGLRFACDDSDWIELDAERFTAKTLCLDQSSPRTNEWVQNQITRLAQQANEYCRNLRGEATRMKMDSRERRFTLRPGKIPIDTRKPGE